MSQLDDDLARTVFERLIAEARSLTIPELLQLNAAYRGQAKFQDLSASVRWRLRNIGMAAMSFSTVRPHRVAPK